MKPWLATLILSLTVVPALAAPTYQSPYATCSNQTYEVIGRGDSPTSPRQLPVPPLILPQVLEANADLQAAQALLKDLNHKKIELLRDSQKQVQVDIDCLEQSDNLKIPNRVQCTDEQKSARQTFYRKDVMVALKTFRIMQAIAYRPFGDGHADHYWGDLRQQIDFDLSHAPRSFILARQTALSAEEAKVAEQTYEAFWLDYGKRLLRDLMSGYPMARDKYQQETIGRSIDLLRSAVPTSSAAEIIRSLERMPLSWVKVSATNELRLFREKVFKSWFNLLAQYRILARLSSAEPSPAEFALALRASLSDIARLDVRLNDEAQQIENLQSSSPLLQIEAHDLSLLNLILEKNPSHCRAATQLSLLALRSERKMDYLMWGSLFLAPVTPLYLVFPVFALVGGHAWLQSNQKVDHARMQFFAFQRAEESYVSAQTYEDSLTDHALTQALLPLSLIGARSFLFKVRGLVFRP